MKPAEGALEDRETGVTGSERDIRETGTEYGRPVKQSGKAGTEDSESAGNAQTDQSV